MKNLADLRTLDFSPLSEVKARLSEMVRRLTATNRQLVITTNGRPTAVLLSYPDYLNLLASAPEEQLSKSGRVLDLKEWGRGRKKRQQVVDSIRQAFDTRVLGRKGQKTYKEKTLRAFQ